MAAAALTIFAEYVRPAKVLLLFAFFGVTTLSFCPICRIDRSDRLLAFSSEAVVTLWRTARSLRVSPERTVTIVVVTAAEADDLALAMAAGAGTLIRCPGWMYAVRLILLREYSVARLTL